MRKPDKDLPKGFIPEPWSEFDPPGGVVMDSIPEGVEIQRQKGYYRVPLLVSLGEIHHSHFRRIAEWARVNCFGRVHLTKEQKHRASMGPGQPGAGALEHGRQDGAPRLRGAFHRGYPILSRHQLLRVGHHQLPGRGGKSAPIPAG